MFSTSGKQNGAPQKADIACNRFLRKAICLVLALLLLGLVGCGKKSWPEPNADQERYDFKDEQARIAHNCLEIKAKLSGNKDNISKIILELAETDTDTDCPTCPFHPEMRVEFPLSDQQLQIGRNSVALRYCLIEAGASYRWRLVGYNSYPGLGAVTSRILITRPNPQADVRVQQEVEVIELDDSGNTPQIEMEYTDTETVAPEQ